MRPVSADFEVIALGCGRCGAQIGSAQSRCPVCGQQMFITPGGAPPGPAPRRRVPQRVPASTGARVSAYLIDLALVAGACAVLLALDALLGWDQAPVVGAAAPAAAWLLSAAARARGHRTPGQVLTRTSIDAAPTGNSTTATAGGGRAGVGRHLLRTAVLHLGNVLLGAGGLSILADRRRPRRGWHEKISGTTTSASAGRTDYEVVAVPAPPEREPVALRLLMDDGTYRALAGRGVIDTASASWTGAGTEIVVLPIEAHPAHDTLVEFTVTSGRLWMISMGPQVGSVLDNGESVTAMCPGHPYEVGPGTVVHLGSRSFEVAV